MQSLGEVLHLPTSGGVSLRGNEHVRTVAEQQLWGQISASSASEELGLCIVAGLRDLR